MSVFALTGMWFSGKTEVAKYLEKKGAIVFYADRVVHRFYRNKNSEVYRKVVTHFPQVLGKRKEIVRKKLADIVFFNRESLRRLEEIVHPYVIKELRRWIEANRGKKRICIAEVPLLFEKKLQGMFDAVIFIYVPKRILEERIKRKLGISVSRIRKRLSLFLPSRKKLKESNFIIVNNKSLHSLRRKVNRLWEVLRGYKGDDIRLVI